MIDFTLYLITDRKLTGNRTLTATVEEACKAGIRAVQLRERDLNADRLFELAKNLRGITRAYNARLFINDRIDIALAVDADGVHLPESSLPISEVRKLLPEGKLIGASVHSLDGAKKAERDGADFLVLGTIYHTPSKPDLVKPAGTESIVLITQNISVPVFAVGGITPEKARECIEAGAHGIAVISTIMQSNTIGETVNRYKEQLGKL
jgi:thiamine-phosphate pyrophosphorylase